MTEGLQEGVLLWETDDMGLYICYFSYELAFLVALHSDM
jgi:hypothetical protein